MTIDAKILPGIANISPDDRGLHHLPFVKIKIKNGQEKISWWHVRPNGNEYDDKIVGAAYALEALQFLLTTGQENSLLLYNVFAAMGKKKNAHIEQGFTNTFMDFARKGAENIDANPKC